MKTHVGVLSLTHSEESNLDPQLEAEMPTYAEFKLADSCPLARKNAHEFWAGCYTVIL